MIEKIEQNQKTQGGIYAILNVHKDRIYIGQAKCFKQRWKTHQNLLLRNKHRNKFLQNDFNKCKEELGHDDFLEFSVIEIVEDIKDKEFLTSREQVYLDAFIPEGSCYNIVKKAKIEDRSCFSKNPEETREKISNASKKNWENPEYRDGMSERMKKVCENPEYIKNLSLNSKKNWEKPGYRENISESMKKIWENRLSTLQAIFISPDGKEFEVYNIRNFARKHNLNQGNLSSLIKGKRLSHKGWKLKK